MDADAVERRLCAREREREANGTGGVLRVLLPCVDEEEASVIIFLDLISIFTMVCHNTFRRRWRPNVTRWS